MIPPTERINITIENDESGISCSPSSKDCKNQENVETNNLRGNHTEGSHTLSQVATSRNISGNKQEATILIETTRRTTTTSTRTSTKTTTTITTTATTKTRKVESVNKTDVLPGTVATEATVVATEKKRCSLIQDASERIQN